MPWDKQDVWRTSGTHQEAGTNGSVHTCDASSPHFMEFENPWKPLNGQKETQIPQAGHHAFILKLGLALRSEN